MNIASKRMTQRSVALFLGLIIASAAAAQPKAPLALHIAAAADLQPVMPTLAAEYLKQTGTKLEVSFGSSSTLATQIINGAPMDVFLGADFTFPEKIVAANLADQAAPIPYATGTLVLWTRKDSGLAPLSVDGLVNPKIARIAIADELHAPFGRSAYAVLDALKLRAKLTPKIVTAENVAQAAQFAESGNAQAAFISLTLASTEHMRQIGTFERAPKLYTPLRQCGVVLKSSPNLAEAHRFLDWLRSESVQAGLKRFGLEPAR